MGLFNCINCNEWEFSNVGHAHFLELGCVGSVCCCEFGNEGIELTKYYLGANWDAVTPGV